MCILRDDAARELGADQDDPAYPLVMRAYRMGWRGGVREVRFADGVPQEFQGWLDRYFSRCENWYYGFSKENADEQPPIIGEYKNPFYRNLAVNRSCPFCGSRGFTEKDEEGWFSYCGHCRCRTGFYPTQERARKAWNSPAKKEKEQMRKTTDCGKTATRLLKSESR